MSSIRRENSRAIGEASSSNRIVRRMVTLPKTILGGFSRAMNHGLDLISTVGIRRNQQHFPLYHDHPPQPHPQQQQQQLPLPHVQEEWAFLATFEQQYGYIHPFFYACNFMEALKIAEDEHKFMFMYLHSPEHPFTYSFCKETLCSEVVVQFLDANFVSWGGLASRGEGLKMIAAATFRPESFPFCVVIAPAGPHGGGGNDNIVVVQQMEGPISPAELLEILQRTMEEQGSAFGCSRAKEEEKIRADRRLREEQDAAYFAALQIDKENNRLKKILPSQEKVQKPAVEKASNKANFDKKIKNTPIKPQKETPNQGKEVTQILIRFPNGERREQSFACTDKVQTIYRYIDSLGLPIVIVGNYRLISSFPKRVYGVDQMGMTLKDAGLHPKATLFLELL